AYFGALVSSSDEDFEQAKKSLGKPEHDAITYKAIDAYQGSGHSRSAVTRFAFPSRFTWVNRDQLFETARANFTPEQSIWRESSWPGGQGPRTFLFSILDAGRRADRQIETEYVYGEKSYRMRIERSPDEARGREFAAKGLTSNPSQVQLLRGK